MPSSYIYHIFFIHLSVGGHLGCFQNLAIVNNAAVNIGVHVFFFRLLLSFCCCCCFSEIYPGVELPGHVVILFLVFCEIAILFSTMAAPIYIPNTMSKSSLFSTLSPKFFICILFDDSHSDRCEVISHCDFDLHVPDD